MPNWQDREVTMLNLLMFFFMGAAATFAICGIIWQIQIEDYENQLRYWRKEAMTANRNSDYWQTQYSKESK
jgi:hypothetical protein